MIIKADSLMWAGAVEMRNFGVVCNNSVVVGSSMVVGITPNQPWKQRGTSEV